MNIAFQVVGDGPFDLVFIPGFVTHLELAWKLPTFGPVLAEFGSFSRRIKFDKRGTGMSDPVSGAPTLEMRMDDVRAVMDAAGSRRAALFGLSEGASLAVLFAANYPDRTAALVLRSAVARTLCQEIDIRHILGAVRVPTLVLQGSKDRVVPLEAARYIAERIPGAQLVEISGARRASRGRGAGQEDQRGSQAISD